MLEPRDIRLLIEALTRIHDVLWWMCAGVWCLLIFKRMGGKGE